MLTLARIVIILWGAGMLAFVAGGVWMGVRNDLDHPTASRLFLVGAAVALGTILLSAIGFLLYMAFSYL